MIEQAIQHGNWPGARRQIRAALRREPDSHWLLTRLGLTYYEQRDYQRALLYIQDARKLAPDCPLVLWDLAGTCQMLDRHGEALQLFRRIVRRGITAIAFGECGEGVAWARGLVADCWYRIAQIDQVLGRSTRAAASFRRHLLLRGPGCRSIYPIAEIRREMNGTRMSGQLNSQQTYTHAP